MSRANNREGGEEETAGNMGPELSSQSTALCCLTSLGPSFLRGNVLNTLYEKLFSDPQFCGTRASQKSFKKAWAAFLWPRSHTLSSLKATQEGRALADASARVKDNALHTCWTHHHWVMVTGHRSTLESWVTVHLWKGYISVRHGKRVLHLPVDHCFSIAFFFIEF